MAQTKWALEHGTCDFGTFLQTTLFILMHVNRLQLHDDCEKLHTAIRFPAHGKHYHQWAENVWVCIEERKLKNTTRKEIHR